MATLSNNMRKQNFGKTALPGFNQRGNTWKRHALARGGPRHFARCDVVDLHDVQLGAPCQSAWVKKCLWIVKTTEVLWLYIHIHIHIHIHIYIVSVKHAVLHGRNPHTVFVRIQPIFAPKFPRWMAKAIIRNLTYHISKDLGGGSKSKGLTSFLALAWGSQVPCGLVSQAQQCLKMAWPHAAA